MTVKPQPRLSFMAFHTCRSLKVRFLPYHEGASGCHDGTKLSMSLGSWDQWRDIASPSEVILPTALGWQTAPSPGCLCPGRVAPLVLCNRKHNSYCHLQCGWAPWVSSALTHKGQGMGSDFLFQSNFQREPRMGGLGQGRENPKGDSSDLLSWLH